MLKSFFVINEYFSMDAYLEDYNYIKRFCKISDKNICKNYNFEDVGNKTRFKGHIILGLSHKNDFRLFNNKLKPLGFKEIDLYY